MEGRRVFFAIFFFRLSITMSLSCSSSEVEVLEDPVSLNVSSGARAVFTCRGTGQWVTWFLNSENLNMQLIEEMNITHNDTPPNANCTVQSTISILGGAISNNTRIHCLVSVSGILNEKSDEALLRVQGPPGPVGNLAIQQAESRSFLSWTAPYSLNGISTFYNVSVSDESTGKQLQVKTVSGTSCELELTNCHRYTFSVISWNNAGNGSAESLEYLFPGAPVSPLAENISITGLALNTLSGLVTATLQYPVTSNCYSYQNITVEASGSSDKEDETVFSSVSQVDDNIVTVAINGMPLNTVLSVNLVLRNSFGTSPVSNGVMLRTYNTQSVALTRNHRNGTCFQCVFLHNSQTNGCLLKLKPISPLSSVCSGVRNVSITRNNCSDSDTCVSGLYQGMYNIEVYDIYDRTNNSRIHSDQPQILTNIEIDGAPCPAVSTSTDLEVATVTRHSTASVSTVSVNGTPMITVGPAERNVGNIRTAGVLIGVFGGILSVILLVMLVIFIFRKRQVKGGSLRIDHGIDDPNVPRVSTVQGEMSQLPSFSSLGPPPYQPPPQITRDEHFTEQYVLMHSAASTRSPSASNSTSSHLGLVQASSSKDLTVPNHYDHLYFQPSEEDTPKKYPLTHLVRGDTDRFSFELKTYRNEHLV